MKVVHCKKESYDVLIDRSTKWGNPYSHKAGTKAKYKTKTRKESIEKYEEYLLNNEELLFQISELRDKVLGCWRKPKACHGDVLLKYANNAALVGLAKNL